MSAYDKGNAPAWSTIDETPSYTAGGYPMATPNYWDRTGGDQPTAHQGTDPNSSYPGGCPAPDYWDGNWNQRTTSPDADVSGPTLFRSSSMGEDSRQDPLTEFTEKSLRRGFVRKVFAILAAQLLVTFGIMAIFVLVDEVKTFAKENSWVLIAAGITTIVLVIALACSEKLRRGYPQNLICLIIFTLAEAWMLGAVSCQYDVDEVLMATGICAGVTFVMCLFGLQSKVDLTIMTGGLIVLTMCLLGFGLLCLIIQDRFLQLMYASIGALLFSLWIAVDIQLVMGKGKYALDSEEYIMAALNIYLDIITLFLFLLQIIGGNK